jgi:hypothetical protein
LLKVSPFDVLSEKLEPEIAAVKELLGYKDSAQKGEPKESREGGEPLREKRLRGREEQAEGHCEDIG